jgi:hypothetical protein
VNRDLLAVCSTLLLAIHFHVFIDFPADHVELILPAFVTMVNQGALIRKKIQQIGCNLTLSGRIYTHWPVINPFSVRFHHICSLVSELQPVIDRAGDLDFRAFRQHPTFAAFDIGPGSYVQSGSGDNAVHGRNPCPAGL